MVRASTIDFFIALAIWTIAALAVFRHAERHGSQHATAWGIGVFLAFLVALPLYVAHCVWLWRRARTGSDHTRGS
jgi:hypothetical protein